MSSSFGKNIRVSLFGQSHGEAVGVVIDGLPSGIPLDIDYLEAFLKRRAPAFNPLGTKRNEIDTVEILSGLVDGHLCGAPFGAIIRNKDIKRSDYSEFLDKPRPGHADFTAQMKYKGAQDFSGGGHFSGRLTAPLCIAGAVCLKLLSVSGIFVGAHIERIGNIWDSRFDPVGVNSESFDTIKSHELPVINEVAGKEMSKLIRQTALEGDSIGGAIECAVVGLPAGIGEPIFDGLENRISAAVFGIPAVKGIEFGSGFACSSMRGSEHNDSFISHDGVVKTATNNHGGILAGISSGMPLLFTIAVKPTASIAKEQNTVSLSRMENTKLSIKGRHDPCIVPRAVPCVEAAAAIAVYDAFLDYKKYQ